MDPFEDSRFDPLPEFLGIPGPNPDVFDADSCSLTDVLEKFLPDDVWQDLVNFSNERARIFGDNSYLDGKIHGLIWRDISIVEMKKFFGYCLNMGLVRKPELSM